MRRHATGSLEIRRRARGYSVEGPGFYVWDEDPREVTRVGRDLARRLGCELPAEPELVPATDLRPVED